MRTFVQLTTFYSSGIKLPGEMENSACTLEKIIPPKSVKFPVGTTKPELIMKAIVAKFVDQPVAFSLQTSKVTLWKCFPMRLVQHWASNLTIKLKPSMVSMVPSLNYRWLHLPMKQYMNPIGAMKTIFLVECKMWQTAKAKRVLSTYHFLTFMEQMNFTSINLIQDQTFHLPNVTMDPAWWC